MAILLSITAVSFTPNPPDRFMEAVTAATINKKRFFPEGVTTHLTLVSYFDECPSYQDVFEAKKILLDYDRFTSVAVPSKNAIDTRWLKVDNFKLEDHIQLIEVETEDALEVEILGLTTGQLRPLDPKKPLWRVEILRCLNGRSSVVFIVDHSIGDGLGLLPVSMRYATCMDGSPFVFGDFKPKRAAKKPSPFHLAINALKDLYTILSIPSGPFDSACNINRNAEKQRLVCDPSKRVIAKTPDFELSDILNIKAKLDPDYTVNDVLTALYAGGIRRYLLQTNDPKVKDSPNSILIRGQAPVALPRPTVKSQVYCKMVFLVFHFPVSSPTIKERLIAVHKEFEIIKNSLQVPIVNFVSHVGLRLGLDSLLIDANTKQWHKTSFIFSNVPGPKERIKMFGKELVEFRPYYSNLIHQVIFFSYAGKVSLSMVLDVDNIKEPKLFSNCMIEELEAMKEEFSIKQ